MTKTKTEETKSPEDLPIQEDEEKATLSGFDMDDFRAKPLNPDIKIKKQITTIPVGKPNKQKWFKIHPNMDYPAYLLVWEEDGSSYLVHPDMVPEISRQIKFVILHVAMYYSPNLSHNIFLIPVPQPDSEGKWNNWHESLSVAVAIAKKKWVRLEPNKSIQGYDVINAEGDLGTPVWPDIPMERILAIAFKNNQILTEDHPKLKELRGLA